MNRLFIAIVSFSSMLISTPANCEESPSSTIAAAQKLTELFTRALVPFRALGKAAGNDYLIRQLKELNKDLYALELAKRDASALLNARPLCHKDLGRAAQNISRELMLLRTRLEDLAPRLRIVDPNDTNLAVTDLTNALQTKGAIVVTLENANEATAATDLQDTRLAIKALQECQTAVSKAVAAIEPS